MIEKLQQVMIYVDDVAAMKNFWLDVVGFELIEEVAAGGMYFVEIAPAQSNETSLMLFDRQVIAAQSPELNLGTPSLMFQTQDARALYHKFRDQGIIVGDLIEMPNRLVFNFADPEGHYFAIQESQN